MIRTGTYTASSRVALAAFAALCAGGLFCASGAMAKGKPNPGPGVQADPALAYVDRRLRLNVANADGSAQTVLATSALAQDPFWSPVGDGISQPYHIAYGICSLREIDVTVGNNGVATGTNDRPVPLPIATPDNCADFATFSPKGDALIFGDYPLNGNPAAVWWVPLDPVTGDPDASKIPQEIWTEPDTNNVILWARVNPNGTKIAFVRQDNGSPHADSLVVGDIVTDSSGLPTSVTNLQPLLPKTDGWGPRFLEWKPNVSWSPAPGDDVLGFDSAAPDGGSTGGI